MNLKKDKLKSNTDGYTLLEIIIVLMLTAVVFVAIYSLFSKSMRADTEGRYEIVAGELAQEGVEIIKNKREKNEMMISIWNGSGNEPSVFDEIEATDINKCNPGLTWGAVGGYLFSCDSSTTMQFDKSSNMYKPNCSGTGCVGPVFSRECTTTDSTAGNNILQVKCIVSWKSLLLGGEYRSVKAELVLTDWQE